MYELNFHTKISSAWFTGLSIVFSSFSGFWSIWADEIKFHTKGFGRKSTKFFAYENFFLYSSLLLHCLFFFDFWLGLSQWKSSLEFKWLKVIKTKKSASVTSNLLPAIIFQQTLSKVITCVIKCQHGFAFHIRIGDTHLSLPSLTLFCARSFLTKFAVLISTNDSQQSGKPGTLYVMHACKYDSWPLWKQASKSSTQVAIA